MTAVNRKFGGDVFALEVFEVPVPAMIFKPSPQSFSFPALYV